MIEFDTSVDEYTLVEAVRSYIIGDIPPGTIPTVDDPAKRLRCLEVIEKYIGGSLKVDVTGLDNFVLALTAIDLVRQHAVQTKPSLVTALGAAQVAAQQLSDLFGDGSVQSALCETVQAAKLAYKKQTKPGHKKPSKIDIARQLLQNNPNITSVGLAELLQTELGINIGYARTMTHNIMNEA